MFGLISAGVNLATGIAKGIVAKNAHDKYAKTLGETELHMPDSILQAEDIKRKLANGDMPGYETMLGDIQDGQARTMTQAKDVAGSPSALLDALVTSSTNAENQSRNLGIQNAMFQQQGQNNLANFLSTVKSPAEQRLDQFEVDKKIAIAKEKMAGTKELLGGIEGGIGSAFSSFGAGQKLDWLGDEHNKLMDFWGNMDNNNSSSGTYAGVLGKLQQGFGGMGGGSSFGGYGM